ncbi:hypothetical protein IV42_GL000922 [Lentilactobacillus parabuchneri]|nr:hypothetical protein IV42_GL000922 [Lentilactobacillus parabuchneri]
MNHDLVKEVKEFMSDAAEKGIFVENLNFDQYYNQPDTNERAEIALRNKLLDLKDMVKQMEDSQSE